MEIYVVRPGDTLFSVAASFGLSSSYLSALNQIPEDESLVVGQTIVIIYPEITHTVAPGESLSDIAELYGVTLNALFRNNINLGGRAEIFPGQTLVISQRGSSDTPLSVNGYAYPFISQELLSETLPYCTYLSPFTYGITGSGELVPLNDETLLSFARGYGRGALMHLSTLTEEGNFNSSLAEEVLASPEARENLARNILSNIRTKGYDGLDIDFEFIPADFAAAYAAFIGELRSLLNPFGYPVIAALAPKTSATQRGLLYEGHDYSLIGDAANYVLLMTYEWGYTYGPPLAVAPIPNVRRVIEYALMEIPPEKIYLGIPNYGYDWTLPFVQGESRAQSLSSEAAVSLARRFGAEILFDETARSPYFYYTDEQGRTHEVWFEDARSILAKLSLIKEYSLFGAGYWNLMRPFPQNWVVLNFEFNIS